METIGFHCKELPCLVLFIGPVHDAVFCLLVRYRTLCFLVIGPIHGALFWSGKERFVLLIGPVQNALLCLMVRYRTLSLVNGPLQ